ncbi:hypothetical protein GIB67_010625, partial [Kingdonia uniflora]
DLKRPFKQMKELDLNVVVAEIVEKIAAEMKKSSLLTTLFQSSGVAMNEQGFINVTKTIYDILDFLVTGSPKASKAPAPTKASPSAPSESPSDSADAPSDNADVPSEADAPDVSDSPLNSPPMAIADEPAGDSDESPAPSPPKTKSSSSARVTLGGFVAIVIVAVSSLVAL